MLDQIISKLAKSRYRLAMLLGLSLVLLVFLRGARLGGDPASFMVLGEKFSIGQGIIEIPIMDEGGYDGQFFGRIALDPYNFESEILGIRIDKPAYRFQRIFYPLLAWAAAFGQADFIPVSLIAVNIVALVLLMFCLGQLASHYGFAAYWGLLIAVMPGLLMGLARDLAEPVTACLLVASMLALCKKEFLAYAILASLCVLTRETSLLFFASVGISHLVLHRKLRLSTVYFVVPALVWGMWQGILWRIFEQVPILSGPSNFTAPFGGLLAYGGMLPEMPLKEVIVQSIYMVFFLVFAGYCCCWFRTKSQDLLVRSLHLCWLLWTVAALFFSHLIWEDDWSYCRVLSDWLICGFLFILIHKKSLPRPLTICSLAVSAGTVLRLLIKV